MGKPYLIDAITDHMQDIGNGPERFIYAYFHDAQANETFFVWARKIFFNMAFGFIGAGSLVECKLNYTGETTFDGQKVMNIDFDQETKVLV